MATDVFHSQAARLFPTLMHISSVLPQLPKCITPLDSSMPTDVCHKTNTCCVCAM